VVWTATRAVKPVSSPETQAWEMFASADEEGSPNPLRHFGPLGYARQDRIPGRRVVRVLLAVTDEPADGDYWAWLDYGVTEPSCIGATEAAMTERFLLGADAPGPREEERYGQGRILRLRVSVVEEVALRSSRNRPISSAL
jgi:hypothetical protein